MNIPDFLIGVIMLALGIVSMKYNYQLVGMTGNVGFAERYLGAGGTYGLFKFLSILLCIFGFLYMFNLSDPVIRWLVSPLAQFFPKGNNGL